MELEQLDITPRLRNYLIRNNITIEKLENYDLPTFEKKYCKPNKYIMQEILQKGFLKPKNGEKYIRDLEISKRLQNILEENGIYYLSNLKYCTEFEIKRYRNLGNVAFNELIDFCNKYNTNLYNMPKSTPESWKRKRYYIYLEDYCAKKQIDSLEIFQNITTLELYDMTEQNYILTASLYKFLNEIQTFKPWENAFIFEYIDMYYAKRFYLKCRLMYMSDLSDLYNDESPELMNYYQSVINSALKKWNKIAKRNSK